MRSVEDRLHDYTVTLDEAARARDLMTGRARHARPDTREALAGGRHFITAIAVGCLIIGGVAAIVVARHGHGSASPQVTTATLPRPGEPLRVLFTRTSPDGVAIVARAGLVPVAEAAGCRIVPVATIDRSNPYCTNKTAPGVEFDYSVGSHTYRVTVLHRDVTSGARALEPMTLPSLFREVRADGTTTATSGRDLAEIAVMHANGLAKVRANRADGRPDLMAPVDGWVAFAARRTSSGTPFGKRIEGLDAAGRILTTALPWRCC